MTPNKIWLIDENEDESTTYARRLGRLMPQEIQVQRVYPLFPHKQDYLKLLIDEETVCIIIDQRLKESGRVNFLGIELAEFLRAVNLKIPIYILTNYKDIKQEYSSGEWSVDDVISKTEFSSEEGSLVVQARLLRRIEGYQGLLVGKSKRFNYLLRRYIGGEISAKESAELEELQIERTAPIQANEALNFNNREHEIDLLLSKANEILGKLDQNHPTDSTI